MQNNLFKHRVYKDYSSLHNYVLRNINSCETNEQLQVSFNVFKQGLKVVKLFHKNNIENYLRLQRVINVRHKELKNDGKPNKPKRSEIIEILL